MKKENIVDGNIILAKMQNEAGRDLSGSFKVTLETVRSWVKEAEVKAEYAHVKHGFWDNDNSAITSICSRCHKDIEQENSYDYKFCPYCGAKMEG